MALFDSLRRDIRHAARTFRRTPGFTAATIIVLAIGIGGTTLVFSIVETLLLRPLPYSDPDRLMVVTVRAWSWPGPVHGASWPVVGELRKAHDVFAGVGAYADRRANLSWDRDGERAVVARATADFLSVLGVRPAIGRGFDENDAGTHAAIISDALWRRRYGASRDVLGRALTLDDQRYTVVGVLPPDFKTLGELRPAEGATYDAQVAVFVPFSGIEHEWDPLRTGVESRPVVFARLQPSISAKRAEAEAAGLADRVVGRGPEALIYGLSPVSDAVREGLEAQMIRLAAAVFLLLLVACANVANLLLERSEGRRREMAICTALGASTGRLLQEVVVHAVLLGMAGGVAGVIVARAAIRVVQVAAGQMLTRLDAVTIDLRVLAFAAVVSLAAGLLASVIPAIRLARTPVAASFVVNTYASGRTRRLPLPSLLVVVEVGLSLVLIVVGALTAGDLRRMVSADLGFRPHGVLTAEVSLSHARYRREAGRMFFESLLRRVSALPDAKEVALAQGYPGNNEIWGTTGLPEGRSAPEAMMGRSVSVNYFSVLAIPIVAGRSLLASDDASAPLVAVVNEAFAHKYWGGAREALGKRLTFGDQVFSIVGVAADVHADGTPRDEDPIWHLSYEQFRSDPFHGTDRATLLLRSRHGDGTAMAGPLRRVMREIDPSQPLYNVIPLERVVLARLARPRLVVTMMALFGALTLLLAAVGVHAVMAYAVALRKREIGVRLALGAMPHHILGLVVGRSSRLVGAGIFVSLPVTLGLAWLSSSEFFAVSGTDPATCTAAVALIAVVGLAASLVPAARAMRVDPIDTLRSE